MPDKTPAAQKTSKTSVESKTETAKTKAKATASAAKAKPTAKPTAKPAAKPAVKAKVEAKAKPAPKAKPKEQPKAKPKAKPETKAKAKRPVPKKPKVPAKPEVPAAGPPVQKEVASGILVSYQRGALRPRLKYGLVRLEGVTTEEQAAAFVGHRVVLQINDRVNVSGRVIGPHGGNGLLRVRFHRGIAPDALAREVKLF